MQDGAWLTGAERDDAAYGIVRGDAHGDAVAGNDLDAESPHASTQLGQYFVSGFGLHAIQPTAVDGHHGALHVNQIVFAQGNSNQEVCHIASSMGNSGLSAGFEPDFGGRLAGVHYDRRAAAARAAAIP
jgi:hypothetical protein